MTTARLPPQLSMSSNGDIGIVPNSLTPINFAPYGGSLFMCAGSTTPWQSHLGGEESNGVNARDFAGAFSAQLTTTVTASVGFNTINRNTFAHAMRYWGIYPNNMTDAAIVQYFDPYMCVRFCGCARERVRCVVCALTRGCCFAPRAGMATSTRSR